MVLPAMEELWAILRNKDTADADKLKAINMVLNRTGYSERQQIDVGLREPTPFDNLSKGAAFRITRGQGLREELGAMPQPGELPTPADDSEGGGDDGLEAFLDKRARDREREDSTRINNEGHVVVPGETQRTAADPWFTEEREREEYERSRTEHDPSRRGDPARSYEDRLRERVEESERR